MKSCTRIYILVFLTSTAGSCAFASPNSTRPRGLTVKDGVLTRSNKEYRAIGVNYFDLFSRTLKNPSDKSYNQGLSQLSQANIPFARFMCCGFWPVDWDLYLNDKEAYFKLLDDVIESAAKYNVGLIPSLFWHISTIPDIVAEPMDQFANPDSKTSDFLRTYTEQVVSRYKDSPAIWGWEFGNEFNLTVDLPNASDHRPPVWPNLKTASQRTARDELTSQQMLAACKTFARVVRKHDKHRIIITGNSLPRPSAFHNTLDKSWTADTPQQFGQVLLRDNPDPFDTISVHIYPDNDSLYPAKANNINELITTIRQFSAKANKPVFVGEFGVPASTNTETEKAAFKQILDSIEKQNIPLSALWVYDYPNMENHWNVTTNNNRAYMLKMISQANQRINR